MNEVRHSDAEGEHNDHAIGNACPGPEPTDFDISLTARDAGVVADSDNSNEVVARTSCTALVVWLPPAATTAELMQKSRCRDNSANRPSDPGQGQTVSEPKEVESEELGRRFLESTGLAALAQRVADSAEQIRHADTTAAGLLHASLAPLLALDAAKLVKQPGLKEACAFRGVPFTQRTKKNPDLALLRLTFPGMDGKRASRCARALQFARRNKVGADTFEQFAASKGGIDGCIQAAMEARGRPSGNRASRGKQLVVTLAPDLPDGERAILVRVTGRRAVYVKEVPM